MRRKPTSWKEMLTSAFQRKENALPVGSASTTTSPGVAAALGACTVVSQYGGTASACACAYDGGASFCTSSGTRYVSSPAPGSGQRSACSHMEQIERGQRTVLYAPGARGLGGDVREDAVVGGAAADGAGGERGGAHVVGGEHGGGGAPEPPAAQCGIRARGGELWDEPVRVAVFVWAGAGGGGGRGAGRGACVVVVVVDVFKVVRAGGGGGAGGLVVVVGVGGEGMWVVGCEGGVAVAGASVGPGGRVVVVVVVKGGVQLVLCGRVCVGVGQGGIASRHRLWGRRRCACGC